MQAVRPAEGFLRGPCDGSEEGARGLSEKLQGEGTLSRTFLPPFELSLPPSNLSPLNNGKPGGNNV